MIQMNSQMKRYIGQGPVCRGVCPCGTGGATPNMWTSQPRSSSNLPQKLFILLGFYGDFSWGFLSGSNGKETACKEFQFDLPMVFFSVSLCITFWWLL